MLATNLGGAGVKDSHKLVANNYTSGSCIQWINSCSDEFANKVGFPLFSGSLQNELRKGNNQTSMYLGRSITGMSDVRVFRIRYYAGPELTDLTSIDESNEDWSWTYNSTTGRVYTVDGNKFFSNSNIEYNWEFQYDYGLVGPVPADGIIVDTIVPADIQWAIAMMVKRKINLHQQMGMTAGTTGAGNSVTYNPDFVPREVQEIINKYRRYV